MSQKFIITIGHIQLAFDSAETAMRAYALLTESAPCTSPYLPYGSSEFKRPDSLEGIQYVREKDEVSIELKRLDSSKFALHLTEEEFKEKCRVQPTEVEGEARLLDVETPPAQIEAPSDEAESPEAEPFF